MIKIKNVTLRNFLSVGNITQAVNLQDSGLTLVLGNNLDLGGDGSRNGVGKTCLVNAISYALYGNAISNIKKNNLINLTNKKGMLVTVEFEINGNMYRIERGRSPNVLRFLVNEVDAVDETDEGQGEMRLTQQEIENVIGMNHTMFKHLVALNTYNEPFLALRANDQREIIENLLGITLLSEKAQVLKELVKNTKDQIKEEEYRIKGVENANSQIKKSIEDLQRRQRVWVNKKSEQITSLQKSLDELEIFDIEHEIEQHIALDEYNRISGIITECQRQIAALEAAMQKEVRNRDKAKQDLEFAKNHQCYACGQELHDESTQNIITAKTNTIAECEDTIVEITNELEKINAQLAETQLPETKPQTKYNTAQEAYEQQSAITDIKNQLEAVKASEDPYVDQIISLQESGVQEIAWDHMNHLHNLKDHQEFLLKLLTNKDSFIRKKIIEQNLQYLNNRLNFYLSHMGLPHEVMFLSDLTVSITELGRDLDFDNLSRGERNRLILSLSWAFRDVHEITNMPIDFLAIDELIDNGLDSNGVENALGILKKMNRERDKNIFLISHREELIGRVNNILYVVKENGFTSFSENQEFDIE